MKTKAEVIFAEYLRLEVLAKAVIPLNLVFVDLQILDILDEVQKYSSLEMLDITLEDVL